MKKVFLLSMVFLYCMGLATGLAADHLVDQKGCKHLGKMTTGKTVTWSGGCVNGLAEGNGTQVWFKDGVETSRYSGSMQAGARHDNGVYTWANGDRYEGNFQNNQLTGKGVYTWPAGNRYEGDFLNNKTNGKGIYTWANGDRYEGDFRDGKRTGKGIIVWADKSPRYGEFSYKRYEGDFLDGRITGQGIAQSSGVVWEGGFLNGRWLDSKFHQTVSGAAITRHRIEMNAYSSGPESRKTKYGMLNNKMEIFVAPVFDILHHYQENFAAALIKGKWGFLNPAGDYAIPPSFDFADSFSEGLARACVGDRWGYINPRGNWVIGPEFEFGEKFSEGLAVVRKDRKFGYIRKDGSMAVEPRFDNAESFSEGLAAVRINGLWGFIDPSGKMIIEPTKKIPNNPGHFKSGVVFYSGMRNVRIMDRSGQMVIMENEKNWSNGICQSSAREFSADGLASFTQHGDPVTGKRSGFSDFKHGYINTQGRVVIDPVYYSASEFLSGWANVRKNMSTEGAAGYVYIDTKGREGRPKVFEDNLDFDVLAEKRQHYLINTAGEKVLDLTAILHRQLPRLAGIRMTNPEFVYRGGGVVSYTDDRTNTHGIISDGRWIIPGISLNQCSYRTFRDELLNAIVLKFDSRKGTLVTYNAEGRWEKTPIERLIPDMAARRLYYESAVTNANPPAIRSQGIPKPKGRVLD